LINRLNDWQTQNVTNMQQMFLNCTNFNQPVNFNTQSVTIMASMFSGCTNFNQPVIFNIPLVTNLSGFLTNAISFSTTNMDNCLINFASQTTQNNVVMTGNRPRTSASNSAVATLQSRGWTGVI